MSVVGIGISPLGAVIGNLGGETEIETINGGFSVVSLAGDTITEIDTSPVNGGFDVEEAA